MFFVDFSAVFYSKNFCFLQLFLCAFCSFSSSFSSSVGLLVFFRVIISIWCCFYFRRRTMSSVLRYSSWTSQVVRRRFAVVCSSFSIWFSRRVVWMRKKTFAARLNCLQITVKDFLLTFLVLVERIWLEIGLTRNVHGRRSKKASPRAVPECESQKLQSGCVHL